MRFTRAAPARPTSRRTWPTYRCVAPRTAARSGSADRRVVRLLAFRVRVAAPVARLRTARVFLAMQSRSRPRGWRITRDAAYLLSRRDLEIGKVTVGAWTHPQRDAAGTRWQLQVGDNETWS